VVQTLTGDEIRALMAKGILVTINSDDPAYFRGYMNENLEALAADAGFGRDEIAALTRNAFAISWAEPDLKTKLSGQLETYLTAN
jgi:adenosine deaminase